MRVFVYGTLRTDQVNHYWLEEAHLLGRCVLKGGWRLYDLGLYPAVVEDADVKRSLTGEVYQVTAEQLAKLDELEEYPTLYGRKEVDTPLGRAWIYYYQLLDEYVTEIKAGDWCQYTPLN